MFSSISGIGSQILGNLFIVVFIALLIFIGLFIYGVIRNWNKIDEHKGINYSLRDNELIIRIKTDSIKTQEVENATEKETKTCK